MSDNCILSTIIRHSLDKKFKPSHQTFFAFGLGALGGEGGEETGNEVNSRTRKINVDPANRQISQKFSGMEIQISLRQDNQLVIASCCLYIPQLVPSTCGFCVTSVVKYSLTV